METIHSSDVCVNIIASVIRDVQTLRNDVLTPRAARLTIQKIESRVAREGLSFLTKTLPRLGKAFDKALHSLDSFDAVGFQKIPNSKLPRFLGELFGRVFTNQGEVLSEPCVTSIRQIRQILYLFYKYKLPYSKDQEQEVVNGFIKTEDEISHYHETLNKLADLLDSRNATESHQETKGQGKSQEEEDRPLKVDPFDLASDRVSFYSERTSLLPELSLWKEAESWTNRPDMIRTIRKARLLLARVFSGFDCADIVPKHGPGAVSTRESLWHKFSFTQVSPRVAAQYPIDAYYYASLGHVCDELDSLSSIELSEVPARVILVPKDSRGPRLISCEPLAMQWIQQGLGNAIMKWIDHHPLSRYNVHFTDQQPNQIGALLGSTRGHYSTLDLKEASDRVTVGLVRCLFPSHMLPYLMATRSTSTQLPNGSILKLNKFAPMGSALCFPILALTVWAILSASSEDADSRETVLVYGDDVIVKTINVLHAIQQLESFGLLVNRDKSCFRGFFRESCGVDAYKGYNVTPFRIKTVWTWSRSPGVYSSWIAYANQFFDKGYFSTYESICQLLFKQFGQIPHDGLGLPTPSLREVPPEWQVRRSRSNRLLQKKEYYVYDLALRPIKKTISGWKMLLRYFTEGHHSSTVELLSRRKNGGTDVPHSPKRFPHINEVQPFSASMYTKRNTVSLVKRWR